jgi:hypothetical protein
LSLASAVRFGLLAFVAALLLVGCGGSPSSESKASPSPTPSKEAVIASVDACSLVTDADASAAVGTDVTNLTAAGGTQVPGACIFASTSGSSQASVFVFAQLYPDSKTADDVKPEQIAAVYKGFGVADAKAVTGIGDKAIEYTVTGAQGGSVIFVFKSNVVLMIAIMPADSGKLETLARSATGKLHS